MNKYDNIFFSYIKDSFLDKKFLIECFTYTHHDVYTVLDSPEDGNGINYIIIDPERLKLGFTTIDKFKAISTYEFEKNSISVPDHTLGKFYYMYRTTNFKIKDGIYSIIFSDRDNVVLLPIKYIGSIGNTEEDRYDKLYDFTDELIISKGMVANYTSPSTIKSTIGRFLLNHVLLANNFEEHIPYYNKPSMQPKDIEGDIAKLCLLKIVPNSDKSKGFPAHEETTVNRVKQYLNSVYFISSLGEICVPSFTEKSLTVDKELIAFRDTLFEENKDNLGDPLIVIEIERKLIEKDKARLKGDPSEGYYIFPKNWNVHRKQQFITTGMVEEFSDKSTNLVFIKNSLSEGLQASSMAVSANDIRKGGYGRAKESAKTGELSKFLLRIFQNTSVTMDDCKSKFGISFILDNDNISNFEYRYAISGDSLVLITPETRSSFLNKKVLLRSPLFCKSKVGLCGICCGGIISKLGQKALGALTLGITEPIFTASMKSIHGKSMKKAYINNIADYIV